MLFRKRSLPAARVDMTPMIDIVFLLIIFFMVSSTFINNRGIKVHLPKSTTFQTEDNNQIVISIKNNSELYLNEKKILKEELGELLKNKRIEFGQNIVVIKGDKEVPYSKMIEVMDIAKTAGLERISLATSPTTK